MMIHKNLITIIAVMCSGVAAIAQNPTAEDFQNRYNLLVSKLGSTGVGIETLLDKWEEAYPDDINMLTGKFAYYFAKSQSSSVEPKDQSKYLGEKPILTLNDSTGRKVNYFQVISYDDILFGKSQQAIDKAIQLSPERLDLRFQKIASLVGYEQESPDMALSDLRSLIIYNETRHPKWVYPGAEQVNDEFFSAAIQEYCFLFFKYATPATYEAFRQLSSTMLTYEPDNILFLDNMGSYYLVVKRDDKTAAKYYNKVLKIKPDDLTAIRNMIILARNSKNTKLERKYLPLLVEYTDSEAERLSSEKRLESLSSMK